MLPVMGGVPKHDYAELATPPYQSVNPLLISTDFSFRAQDVVAWNPRRFRFADGSGGTFQRMLGLYDRYRRSSPSSAKQRVSWRLLASKVAGGELQILDAHFVPGTADQAKYGGGGGLALEHVGAHGGTAGGWEGRRLWGGLTWMRFRISLELPAGFHVGSGDDGWRVQECQLETGV